MGHKPVSATGNAAGSLRWFRDGWSGPYLHLRVVGVVRSIGIVRGRRSTSQVHVQVGRVSRGCERVLLQVRA